MPFVSPYFYSSKVFPFVINHSKSIQDFKIIHHQNIILTIIISSSTSHRHTLTRDCRARAPFDAPKKKTPRRRECDDDDRFLPDRRGKNRSCVLCAFLRLRLRLLLLLRRRRRGRDVSTEAKFFRRRSHPRAQIRGRIVVAECSLRLRWRRGDIRVDVERFQRQCRREKRSRRFCENKRQLLRLRGRIGRTGDERVQPRERCARVLLPKRRVGTKTD